MFGQIKANSFIGIFFVYFDSQTKIHFEQIRTNSNFFSKYCEQNLGFEDPGLGVVSDKIPIKTTYFFQDLILIFLFAL